MQTIQWQKVRYWTLYFVGVFVIQWMLLFSWEEHKPATLSFVKFLDQIYWWLHVNHFFMLDTPYGNVEPVFEYFKELLLCHSVKVSSFVVVFCCCCCCCFFVCFFGGEIRLYMIIVYTNHVHNSLYVRMHVADSFENRLMYQNSSLTTPPWPPLWS